MLTRITFTHLYGKANATGRNFKTLREFLEKHYKEGDMTTDKCIELAIKCLMEVCRVYM